MEKSTSKGFALELLNDARKQNKRLFIIWLITFTAFIILLGYTVYLLNDIGTIETTQEISEVDTINYSNISNGGK